MAESFKLKSSRIHVDVRDGYIHVVAVGILRDLDEVREHNALMEELMVRHGTRRVIIDARGQTGEPPPEVRAAVWDWFKSERAFELVAYVVGESDEMKAARVNMTALSLGTNLRAFTKVIDAHRFLTMKRARTTGSFPVVRVPKVD
jgi:hypothetical protein